MTRCPHCNAVSNPLRFIIHSRWTPYKCGNCGRHSRFNTNHLAILGGIGGGLGGGLSGFVLREYGWMGILVLIIAILFLLTIVMWTCLRMSPIEEHKALSDHTNLP